MLPLNFNWTTNITLCWIWGWKHGGVQMKLTRWKWEQAVGEQWAMISMLFWLHLICFTSCFKDSFYDLNILFLWYSSVDISKTSSFLNFQVILMYVFVSYILFSWSFCCTGCWNPDCVIILPTNNFAKKYCPHKHYAIKGFYCYKISTFF